MYNHSNRVSENQTVVFETSTKRRRVDQSTMKSTADVEELSGSFCDDRVWKPDRRSPRAETRKTCNRVVVCQGCCCCCFRRSRWRTFSLTTLVVFAVAFDVVVCLPPPPLGSHTQNSLRDEHEFVDWRTELADSGNVTGSRTIVRTVGDYDARSEQSKGEHVSETFESQDDNHHHHQQQQQHVDHRIRHIENKLEDCLPDLVNRVLSPVEVYQSVLDSSSYYDFYRTVHTNGSTLTNRTIDRLMDCGQLFDFRRRHGSAATDSHPPHSRSTDYCTLCSDVSPAAGKHLRLRRNTIRHRRSGSGKDLCKNETNSRDRLETIGDSLCQPITVLLSVDRFISTGSNEQLDSKFVTVQRCPRFSDPNETTVSVCRSPHTSCVAGGRVEFNETFSILQIVDNMPVENESRVKSFYHEVNCSCKASSELSTDVTSPILSLPPSLSPTHPTKPTKRCPKPFVSGSNGTCQCEQSDRVCKRIYEGKRNQSLSDDEIRCVRMFECDEPTCNSNLVYNLRTGKCEGTTEKSCERRNKQREENKHNKKVTEKLNWTKTTRAPRRNPKHRPQPTPPVT